MKPSAKVWFVTFMALVFTTGVLAGLILDRTWLVPQELRDELPGGRAGGGRGGRGSGRGLTSADVAAANVERLDRDLHLTPDQRTQMLVLFEAWDARMRKAQDSVQQTFREEQQRLRADVEKILTSDQTTRFREIAGRILVPSTGRGPGGRPGGPGRGLEGALGERPLGPPPPRGRGE